MTYRPVLPISGLAGWRFLQRTMPAQTKAFAESAAIQRDTAYFREKIGAVNSAAELVSDRRLMTVALGAYGLQDDLNNRYYIQKILEDGTLTEGALATRLSDDRYRVFSAAFGFGDFDTPRSKISDFGDKVVARFERQSFEVAVGEQDNAMRLALNAERELETLAAGTSSDTTKWLRILGTPPLREVFETAFGLPRSFGQIDLDRQVEIFRDRMVGLTGASSIDQFVDPEARTDLIERYLLRDQVASVGATVPGALVLSILQDAANFSHSLGRP